MAARVAFVMLWLHGGIKVGSKHTHTLSMESLLTNSSQIAQFQPGECDELFVRLGLVAMVAFSLLIIILLH